MSDTGDVNTQVVNALQVVSRATMAPDVVKTAGAGKAYQSVAQSAALAVQDATDNLRNVSTIGATAIGVAMAQYIETGNVEYRDVLKEAQGIVTRAAQDFKQIGETAAYILNSFPGSGVTG